MDYPCGKFVDCSFSRFGSIVRTDRQTDRKTDADADERFTRAILVGVSDKWYYKTDRTRVGECFHVRWNGCAATVGFFQQRATKNSCLESVDVLFGLRINKEKKTKLWKLSRHTVHGQMLANGSIDEVEEFIYLGSVLPYEDLTRCSYTWTV